MAILCHIQRKVIFLIAIIMKAMYVFIKTAIRRRLQTNSHKKNCYKNYLRLHAMDSQLFTAAIVFYMSLGKMTSSLCVCVCK
jgi:hypothetical protein